MIYNAYIILPTKHKANKGGDNKNPYFVVLYKHEKDSLAIGIRSELFVFAPFGANGLCKLHLYRQPSWRKFGWLDLRPLRSFDLAGPPNLP